MRKLYKKPEVCCSNFQSGESVSTSKEYCEYSKELVNRFIEIEGVFASISPERTTNENEKNH